MRTARRILGAFFWGVFVAMVVVAALRPSAAKRTDDTAGIEQREKERDRLARLDECRVLRERIRRPATGPYALEISMDADAAKRRYAVDCR